MSALTDLAGWIQTLVASILNSFVSVLEFLFDLALGFIAPYLFFLGVMVLVGLAGFAVTRSRRGSDLDSEERGEQA